MSMMGEYRSGDDLPIAELVHRPQTLDESQRLELTRSWSRALVVHEDQSARVVVDIAVLNDMDLIITVDQQDRAAGVAIVTELTHRVRPRRGIVMDGYVSAHYFDPNARFDFEDMFDIKNISPQIRSRRPKLHWCEEGKHETSENPCTQKHSPT